ncbi:hypothetical protein [Paenibacillus sp. BT-177]|uniref:hypothetical protein n=1 Tax=Paenibacillus sp. BT-177 TaxID=2986930 RepID=UPI0021F77EAD|nr:hypothetical protein [Paenibacillus sp. BT-177]
MANDKLEILNSIVVEDWSSMGDTIEYIYVGSTEENVNKLLQIGATMNDIEHNTDFENQQIDISPFAFRLVDADWFDDDHRFWKKLSSTTIEKHLPIAISELVQAAHSNAMSKGWWDEERSFGEIIALIHSEVSEALEDYRNGRDITEVWYENKELKTRLTTPITPNCKPCGIPSELADIVIRVFDAAGRYGIDLEGAITEKMAYNATRPQRHGGKVL